MTARLEFNWEDDEHCEITFDGQWLITADHDDHGWDGMDGIITALERIADRAGLSRETSGEPGI